MAPRKIQSVPKDGTYRLISTSKVRGDWTTLPHSLEVESVEECWTLRYNNKTDYFNKTLGWTLRWQSNWSIRWLLDRESHGMPDRSGYIPVALFDQATQPQVPAGERSEDRVYYVSNRYVKFGKLNRTDQVSFYDPRNVWDKTIRDWPNIIPTHPEITVPLQMCRGTFPGLLFADWLEENCPTHQDWFGFIKALRNVSRDQAGLYVAKGKGRSRTKA